MAFVAIEAETNASALMWWPLTWSDAAQTVNNTFSLNPC